MCAAVSLSDQIKIYDQTKIYETKKLKGWNQFNYK